MMNCPLDAMRASLFAGQTIPASSGRVFIATAAMRLNHGSLSAKDDSANAVKQLLRSCLPPEPG